MRVWCWKPAFAPGHAMLSPSRPMAHTSWRSAMTRSSVSGSGTKTASTSPIRRHCAGRAFVSIAAISLPSLCPLTENPLVAVGGWGAPTGCVVVIDLLKNTTVHGLTEQKLEAGNIAPTIWCLLFRRPEKSLLTVPTTAACSSNLASSKKNDVQLVGRHSPRKGKALNKVKFLHFRDENTSPSVAQDGLVVQWSPGTPGSQKLFHFTTFQGVTDVHSVAPQCGPEMARCFGEGVRVVELRSSGTGGAAKTVSWPDATLRPLPCFRRCRKRLAIGLEAITQNHESAEKFSEVTGGKVYLYDLTVALPRSPCLVQAQTLFPEAIAFHPTANQSGRRWR